MANNRKDVWKKLTTNPIGYARNALRKLVVDPAKYKTGEDYQAESYWRDRFVKHGMSLAGPGDEGLKEEENRLMYLEAADRLFAIIEQNDIDLPTARVLEIGCGNGFFSGLLYERGVRDYLGVDITDVLFDEFRARWPEFRYEKADITERAPAGSFDLVLMIDVIQHIVVREKLRQAFANIKNGLAAGGAFLVSPIRAESKKHLFYVHWWTIDDLKNEFADFLFAALEPFRYSHLAVIKNTATPPRRDE
ncbi:MAG TPA: class I SAM-dependent methyltransferase [bacterium]|nr:class I SAM-dependent methyltransferase [bacterium]